MNYIEIFDHNTRKRLAFLQNAHGIAYSKKENSVWTASFKLPLSDPKNKFCEPLNFVKIFDGETTVGMFRLTPSILTKKASQQDITYECEHVIATLIDDVLLGWHEVGNHGVYTTDVLRYILDRQSVTRWQLGECDFAYEYLYGWENDNLLSALFSVPNAFTDRFIWKFNTDSYPWLISLKRAPTVAKTDIRYRKNMLGITKTVDPTELCTRLYPLGYGEGDNQLTIESVNPTGRKYIDSDTQAQFGVISRIWVDRRYQEPAALYQAALAHIETLKTPQVSYSVDAAHIGKLLQVDVGDIVRVADEEAEMDIHARVTELSKDDVTGNPTKMSVELGSPSTSIENIIADLADRQRIQETYAQGAVTLYSQSFYDNCSESEPATIRFYIPQNVVHINQVLLTGRAAPFRGYTKATKGGGARSTTTSDGGGNSTSTSSGGGGTTTSSGGGSATSSTNTSQYNTNDVTPSGSVGSGGGSYQAQSGRTNSHFHYYYAPSNHTHGLYMQSHHHQMFHSHTVSIPAHTHSISVGAHSHAFSIPAHSHNFSLPDHTHDIEYGIYKGSTASSLTIRIDGNAVSVNPFGTTVNDLNIIAFLQKSQDGKVNRGWHEITITPDKLTRVEFDLVTQLFANSRGGGQY